MERKLKSKPQSLSKNEFRGSIYEQDIWDGRNLNLETNAVNHAYKFNFTKVNPIWLRQVCKKFIISIFHVKSYNTARTYINAITKFSEFITLHFPNMLPNELDRSVILDFINYLASTKLSDGTRGLILINLRSFIEQVAIDEWQPFPKNRILFDKDLPKRNHSTPRFIPESVMTQLMEHIDSLKEEQARAIHLLVETGRRIGEICTLPINCIKEDDSGYPFLEINDKKTKKIYLIPISAKCLDLIKKQQAWLEKSALQTRGYLFVGGTNVGPKHMSATNVNKILKRLAVDNNILGPDGRVWDFHAHQFRHTVGTRMINSGVPQIIVQRYLGHESSEMTSRYAHIHDQTLKSAFENYKKSIDSVDNELRSYKTSEHEWLRGNVMTQALPNGHCALPFAQNRCPHANACLNCVHFRTDAKYLPQHEYQLNLTNKILSNSKEHGWKRHIELNHSVKQRLERIISSLKGCGNENCCKG